MCEHKNIVRIQSGWHCPDCGQTFAERPKQDEPKQEEPKKKTRKKKEA